MIWCYRTRVGDFELPSADAASRIPERELRQKLVQWRGRLVAGGDLQLSGLSRDYPLHVYVHHQLKGCGALPAKAADDYYSPTHPAKYIQLRIEPSIAFYKARTPGYAMQHHLFKALLLGCTLGATLLSRYELHAWTIAISSAATVFTSWTEYTDVARKTERYTRAAFDLQNLHSWWKSLSEVEKASKTTIAQLIHTAEQIISEERLGWLSTASDNSKSDGPESGSSGPNHKPTARPHAGGGSGKEYAKDAGYAA